MTGRAGDLALAAAGAILLAVVGVTLLADASAVVDLPQTLERALGGVYVAVAVGQAILAIRRA